MNESVRNENDRLGENDMTDDISVEREMNRNSEEQREQADQEAQSDDLSQSIGRGVRMIPSDFNPSDGRQRGMDICPLCKHRLADLPLPESVFDSDGNEFESIFDTDQSKGPWFCPDCWKSLCENKHRIKNHEIAEFGGNQ